MLNLYQPHARMSNTGGGRWSRNGNATRPAATQPADRRPVVLDGWRRRAVAIGRHIRRKFSAGTVRTVQGPMEVSEGMPLLFSYGTLQQDNVQLATFGRLLRGERDELVGFEQTLVKIEDASVVSTSGKTHHPNVTFNGRNESRIAGTAFEITDAELAAADHYETLGGYTRIAVGLASGRPAWLYVRAAPPAAGA
jgi:gamma-glutamylcyclotransferase (GGCT)/AIG2-like uncharacterized protein YtfP